MAFVLKEQETIEYNDQDIRELEKKLNEMYEADNEEYPNEYHADKYYYILVLPEQGDDSNRDPTVVVGFFYRHIMEDKSENLALRSRVLDEVEYYCTSLLSPDRQSFIIEVDEDLCRLEERTYTRNEHGEFIKKVTDKKFRSKYNLQLQRLAVILEDYAIEQARPFDDVDSSNWPLDYHLTIFQPKFIKKEQNEKKVVEMWIEFSTEPIVYSDAFREQSIQYAVEQANEILTEAESIKLTVYIDGIYRERRVYKNDTTL